MGLLQCDMKRGADEDAEDIDRECDNLLSPEEARAEGIRRSQQRVLEFANGDLEEALLELRDHQAEFAQWLSITPAQPTCQAIQQPLQAILAGSAAALAQDCSAETVLSAMHEMNPNEQTEAAIGLVRQLIEGREEPVALEDLESICSADEAHVVPPLFRWLDARLSIADMQEP